MEQFPQTNNKEEKKPVTVEDLQDKMNNGELIEDNTGVDIENNENCFEDVDSILNKAGDYLEEEGNWIREVESRLKSIDPDSETWHDKCDFDGMTAYSWDQLNDIVYRTERENIAAKEVLDYVLMNKDKIEAVNNNNFLGKTDGKIFVIKDIDGKLESAWYLNDEGEYENTGLWMMETEIIGCSTSLLTKIFENKKPL